MRGPSKRSFGFCTRRTPGYTILSMMHSGEEVIPPMDTGMQLGRRMVTEWPNNDKCLLLCVNIGHFIKFSPSSPVTPVAPHSSQAFHLVLSCSLLLLASVPFLMLLYLPDRPFCSLSPMKVYSFCTCHLLSLSKQEVVHLEWFSTLHLT